MIHFKPQAGRDAYEVIADIQPHRLYRWETRKVSNGANQTTANVLFGRSPQRGSHLHEGSIWDGAKEPLVNKAIGLVSETPEPNREFEWDMKPTLRLQMAYMLLWTGIERFTAFKYHLGDQVMAKIVRLATEPAFSAGLLELVTHPRAVHRADDPSKKARLKRDDPEASVEYYYQVRSNIVHRGKAAYEDNRILVLSTGELVELFKRVLKSEFNNGVSA